MKKTLYLTVLTIVTVICIIAGSCYHIIGWGTNFIHSIPFISFNSDNYNDSEHGSSQKTEEVGEFQKLDIQTNVMDVTIGTGTTYSISYNCTNSLIPIYEVKDGTLTITQKGSHTWSWGNNHCDMKITVPADAKLDQCKITSKVGDIDVSNLHAGTFTTNASVGDVDITDSELTNGDVSSSTGDINMKGITFDTMTITSSVGDVNFQSNSNLADYEMDLGTSVGDVEVNNRDQGKNYSNNGSSNNELTINASTGDVNVEY